MKAGGQQFDLRTKGSVVGRLRAWELLRGPMIRFVVSILWGFFSKTCDHPTWLVSSSLLPRS